MNEQDEIHLGGPLGEALEASRRGRLHRFIEGPESAAIRLFDRAIAAGNTEGDWYGEHAGKWLAAAARAAARSGDAELRESVTRVADFLCDQQEPDGYLGTYAPSRRFMLPQPPKPPTPPNWDGAPSVRTWDIWTHSYLILGLLEAHRSFGNPRWLQGDGRPQASKDRARGSRTAVPARRAAREGIRATRFRCDRAAAGERPRGVRSSRTGTARRGSRSRTARRSWCRGRSSARRAAARCRSRVRCRGRAARTSGGTSAKSRV